MIEKMLNAIESLKSNILGSNRLMKSNLTLDFRCSYCALSIRTLFLCPDAPFDYGELRAKPQNRLKELQQIITIVFGAHGRGTRGALYLTFCAEARDMLRSITGAADEIQGAETHTAARQGFFFF